MKSPTQKMEIIGGDIRKLTPEEVKQFNTYTTYKWVTTTPSICKWDDKQLVVPVGFLTDGNSGGPDCGRSWLFHDWLYATHQISPGKACTRQEADDLMEKVLECEGHIYYCKAFHNLRCWNPFYLFSKAWESSGKRGPEFLLHEDDTHE